MSQLRGILGDSSVEAFQLGVKGGQLECLLRESHSKVVPILHLKYLQLQPCGDQIDCLVTSLVLGFRSCRKSTVFSLPFTGLRGGPLHSSSPFVFSSFLPSPVSSAPPSLSPWVDQVPGHPTGPPDRSGWLHWELDGSFQNFQLRNFLGEIALEQVLYLLHSLHRIHRPGLWGLKQDPEHGHGQGPGDTGEAKSNHREGKVKSTGKLK